MQVRTDEKTTLAAAGLLHGQPRKNKLLRQRPTKSGMHPQPRWPAVLHARRQQ